MTQVEMAEQKLQEAQATGDNFDQEAARKRLSIAKKQEALKAQTARERGKYIPHRPFEGIDRGRWLLLVDSLGELTLVADDDSHKTVLAVFDELYRIHHPNSPMTAEERMERAEALLGKVTVLDPGLKSRRSHLPESIDRYFDFSVVKNDATGSVLVGLKNEIRKYWFT